MKKHPSVNPVGLLEIGQHSRPDTPASVGSDISGAPIEPASVLSGHDDDDDGQQMNTSNASGSASVPGISTASGSATVPGSSMASGSANVPGSSTASGSATVTEATENTTTRSRIAGSSDLPAAKRKRKPTKMEKAQ